MIYLNADCMNPETGLPSFPDNHFDLAIVDPPYGWNLGKKSAIDRRKQHKEKSWNESAPSIDYWQQLFRVSKNQIIWGGNYFDLPPTRGIIFWWKHQSLDEYADGEYAWNSFDRNAKLFDYGYTNVINYESRLHPTQKPIALYRWLLKNYAKQGDLILDTHVGSASSLIAFEEMGFDYVGFELDADYYKESTKRLEMFRSQPKLFTGKEIFEASKPLELF